MKCPLPENTTQVTLLLRPNPEHEQIVFRYCSLEDGRIAKESFAIREYAEQLIVPVINKDGSRGVGDLVCGWFLPDLGTAVLHEPTHGWWSAPQLRAIADRIEQMQQEQE